MSSKKSQQKKDLLAWFRRRNWTGIIAAFACALSLFNTYYNLNPPPARAKLTIFIEHYNIWYGTGNELEFHVYGKIVNDSPLTGLIKRWDLFIDLNTSYKLLFSMFIMHDQTLSPSEQANFTMGRTLIGKNNIKLPETAIRSCVAMIWFQDNIGIQVAEREINFA